MISVIIPVYNVPKEYIHRCIDSIIGQSYKDFEILIINDGSNETCCEYLQSIRNKDKRIKVYNQNNKGVSAARNLGIDKCRGRYVTFVDADDEIKHDFFEESINLMKQYDAEIIFGCIEISKNDEIKHCNIPGNDILIYEGSGISTIQQLLLTGQCINNHKELKNWRCSGPWCKLISIDILQKVKFRENISVYEDLLFNLDLLEIVDKAIISPTIWYSYKIFSDSAMRKYRKNGINEQMLVLEYLDSYKSKHLDLAEAIAKKTIECEKKIVTSTLYHIDAPVKYRKRNLRIFVNDKRVRKLTKSLKLSIYPFMNKKEKFSYFLFKYRLVNILHIIYTLKLKKVRW